MTSFDYRLNPRYAIKECSSCGTLYTRDCFCSKGSVEDTILVPKLLKNYASTNVDNSPREPFVVKQDHGVNPPHIDECFCECGDALDGIFYQQCTCKSCGKGAHIGYNCPQKVLIISNPKPCNQTMNNELPQTLPSFDSTCYSDKENSVPCVSKPNFVDESSNIFNPPPQPHIYSCEFCESNAQYSHYCTPQVPFINPEPGYSQNFNFPQYIHDFQQQYLCCEECGGPHETFQCQQKIPACCDDDDDYNSAITPVLSTEETDNSLSMRDGHLDIIPETESDEVIKSSVENLVPILSEFEGIPDTMCDVHLVNNPTPLEAKDHFEIVINSNDDISSNDEDSLYNKNIEYVKASPYDSEVVSLEVAEIVIPEEEEIEDDNLLEKLLNFPPTDRSDFTHEEFADELAHIISQPEYDCFYFGNLPDPGELISILNFRIRDNLSSTTLVNLPVEDDHFPLLAYVVWIFLAYLTYPIIPPYLYSFRNEDTIFDPGIIINRFCSFKPGLSHRCGIFKKFNTHRSHLNESLMEMLFSTCSPTDQ
nr:hypothetical protein [Tanacetum cinerariifolium]